MTLPELTERISLTTPDGRLDRAAVGWARQPLVDTSGIGRGLRHWGRGKRWEYWNVTTPTHILALTASSLDYAAVHEVWVFDRVAQRSWGRSVTVLPSRGVLLPPSLDEGPVRARARGLEIDIEPSVEAGRPGTRLRARIRDAAFDVFVALPPGHERLAVVVPWSDDRFQYTVKDVARPAVGTVTIAGATFPVTEGVSWAVLDHGRGRWPYDVRWNWGAGAGVSGGRVIGLQVGGQWTAGTGSTENAVVIDGRLHFLPRELSWAYDPEDWLKPWHVWGGGLDATLVPVYDKVTRTDLGIVSSSTDQVFGEWSGSFAPPGGGRIVFEAIAGWAEEVHNRW